MTWPQLYVLSALILSGVIGIVSEARDRTKSSRHVALVVMFTIGFKVAMALVLHAGGFW